MVVEHFRAYVAPLIEGQGTAMVVVSSRLEAVRWKFAIEKYVAERGYRVGTLVASSGEVIDEESDPDSLERSTFTKELSRTVPLRVFRLILASPLGDSPRTYQPAGFRPRTRVRVLGSCMEEVSFRDDRGWKAACPSRDGITRARQVNRKEARRFEARSLLVGLSLGQRTLLIVQSSGANGCESSARGWRRPTSAPCWRSKGDHHA